MDIMMKNIENLIKSEAEKFNGEIGIGFKDLKTGKEYYYNGNKRFYMASTFKIYVLIAFYDLVMNDKIVPNDKYLVEKEELLPSSIIALLTQQEEYFIEDLATLMMVFSDNTATDILCKMVTFEHVKEIIEKIGIEKTVINKNCNGIITGFFDISKTDTEEDMINKMKNMKFTTIVSDKDNTTTPRDMVKTLEFLYNNKILNEEYSKKAIDTMLKCMTNNRIPRYLPIEAKTAHKTGTIHGVVNDAGIVFTSKGDYIITFYSNSEPKNGIPINIHSEDFLAQLSRKIYDEYTK